MDRNEILKRVFSNSGLTEMEEGYPSSTLPEPSSQYPYSRPQGREWAYNPPTPGNVTPGPAQWFGGKTGAGGLGGLILPSLGGNPAEMPYEMPMDLPLSQPNYVSQSAADSSANAQQKAQEELQKNRQITKETNIGKQPATKPIIKDQPFEKPQIKREELPKLNGVSLSPQAKEEIDTIDTSIDYPEARSIEEKAPKMNIESKLYHTLDVSKKYPEAKTFETIDTSVNYPEAQRQSIIEKVYPVKSNETVDAVSSADMKSKAEQVKPKQKSTLEKMRDYTMKNMTEKNEAFISNPLGTIAQEAAAYTLAAPVLGGIGSALAVPAAATPIASNILQFPTAQSFPSDTASAVGGKLLQFAPRAAGAAAAVASALPGSAAAESNWNPQQQKYTQPTNKVNNKAMATKTITPSTPSTPSTPASTPSTPSSVSNLLNKLNNAIKGLNIGR